MGVLSNLEPNAVFKFFEEICSIPHGSGNVDKISDYLVKFAKDRSLEYYQDELKNVIIIKEAAKGYEQEKPVIIQGHMDMVAVKTPDSGIDLEKDGLSLGVDGDYIYAEHTSLGGDDGIAVAYALALLDSDSLQHPRLEAILTVDEEVGLDGAKGIDLSMLKGKQLINIDSEEEGFLLTSCAGGCSLKCGIPFVREKREGVLYEISMTGLLGGHSGIEIHKERGNANCLLGRLLYQAAKAVPVSLISLEGGEKDNAIPKAAKAAVLISESDTADFEAAVQKFEGAMQHELAVKDPGAKVKLEKKGAAVDNCLTKEAFDRITTYLIAFPNGVQAMSASIQGLVETSVNLGVMKLEENEFKTAGAVRSSVQTSKDYLIDRITGLCAMAGGAYSQEGDYPAWEYKLESPLRDKMLSVYKDMYGKDMIPQAIHAGLECGLLSGKIEGLDCVSIGPDMFHVHTTDEKLSISSTKRVWEYLVEVLKRK
ncbi:MAG: aminoacyl-histidine dipeptidase [Clostridiales bacterium]|nr:aminoacyl-histidine dipeptidase [Clostridiales bacterium]MDU3244586.1 aminoacyl-histidine dipeptidase [Clostridiales bacterium]